jgi:hypothetical protein
MTLTLNRREMKKWKNMYVVYAVMSMTLRRVIRRAIFLLVFRLKNFLMSGYVPSVAPLRMSFLLNNMMASTRKRDEYFLSNSIPRY